MPAGLTYSQWSASVVNLVPSYATDPNWIQIAPLAIDWAELRCYRDLDFMAAHGSVALGPTTVGTMTLTLPSSIIVLEQLLVGTPLKLVVPASYDFIMGVYSGAANGPPQWWAPIGNTPNNALIGQVGYEIVLGPAPDQAYAATGYGTTRAQPFSSTNSPTWLSQNLPDLFFAATMEFISGYIKNYGSQADDPKMAVSWAQEYEKIKAGVNMEEMRRRFNSQWWTAQQPAPAATPPRT